MAFTISYGDAKKQSIKVMLQEFVFGIVKKYFPFTESFQYVVPYVLMKIFVTMQRGEIMKASENGEIADSLYHIQIRKIPIECVHIYLCIICSL